MRRQPRLPPPPWRRAGVEGTNAPAPPILFSRHPATRPKPRPPPSWGRVGVGGNHDHPNLSDVAFAAPPRPQLVEQRRDDAIGIAENVVVPEAQNLEALAFEPGRARGVRVPPARVLAAVDLDDEEALETGEIDDVTPDGRLAAEPAIVEPSVAQARPQPALGVGRGLAEGAGARRGRGASIAVSSGMPPTPTLPHAGGGGDAAATTTPFPHVGEGRGGGANAPAPP